MVSSYNNYKIEKCRIYCNTKIIVNVNNDNDNNILFTNCFKLVSMNYNICIIGMPLKFRARV